MRLLLPALSLLFCIITCSSGGDAPLNGAGEAPALSSAAPPTFSPPDGTYTTDLEVQIGCTTSDAVIYYTTDGSVPTSNSDVYQAAIKIAGNGTTLHIRAIAIGSGMDDSGVVSASYIVHSAAAAYE